MHNLHSQWIAASSQRCNKAEFCACEVHAGWINIEAACNGACIRCGVSAQLLQDAVKLSILGEAQNSATQVQQSSQSGLVMVSGEAATHQTQLRAKLMQ